MRLVDTHCHLNDAKAFPNPKATLAEARAAGVDRVVVVGIDEASSRSAVILAESREGVYAVVGWHPTCAAGYTRGRLGAIDAMLQSPKAVAIGEVGLDFFWDKATPEQQYACLEDHLDLAEQRGKPVVFHCRDANDELLTFLEERRPLPYLFHCFSGDADQARRALELGAYLGVDGPLTFPKNAMLREVFKSAPRDRVVLETDSPYLAPIPHRGKPNRPAWVTLVNKELALLWDTGEEECAAQTTANAEVFFGL